MKSLLNSRRGDMVILGSVVLSVLLLATGMALTMFQDSHARQQMRREIELEGFAIDELAIAHAVYQSTKSNPVTAPGRYQVPISLDTVSVAASLSASLSHDSPNNLSILQTGSFLPKNVISTRLTSDKLSYDLVSAGGTSAICGVFSATSKVESKLCLAKTVAAPTPTPVEPQFSFSDSGETIAAAMQPDGKLLVLRQLNVYRFNPDLTLDTSFDGDGIAPVATFSGMIYDVFIKDFALATSGKILVAGAVSGTLQNGATAPTDFGLIRLNTNGTRDTSFAPSGLKRLKVSATINELNAMAYQASTDRVMMEGSGPNHYGDNLFMRTNSNGVLDNNFGAGGKAQDNTPYGPNLDWISNPVATGMDSTGRFFVLSGYRLFRYRTNGSKDPSYGGPNGVNVSAWATLFMSLVVQPDDKVVISDGRTVARLDTSGNLDTTFNGTGLIQLNDFGAHSSMGWSNKLALHPDGHIFVGSSCAALLPTGGIEYGYGVAKINPNGTFDNTFGTNGISCKHPVGDNVGGIAVKADGTVYVAGGTVRRFLPNGN